MRQTDKEYAEALFMLSVEDGMQEEYLDALLDAKKVVEENPDYIDFLLSPAVPLKERIDAIEEAFAEALPENVVSYIKLLCEKGRINELISSINEYIKLSSALMNKAYAHIYSAVALSDEQKSALVLKLEKITGKTIEPEYTIDSALIGGIKIEIEGKIYDGSIKTRLRDIKDVILQ